MAKMFRWLLMAVGGLRWARLRARIGNAFRAKAESIPAADAAAQGAMGEATAADPIKIRMVDGNTRQGLAMGLLARGECYRIVLAQLWAGLGAAFRATAAAVPTVAAAIREAWAAAVLASAESVPTTTGAAGPAGQGDAFRAGPEAIPTVLPASTGRSGMTLTAEPTTAAAAEAAATSQTGTRLYAKPSTWFEPVVVDGVLYLRQAVDAKVENGILEVR